MAIVQDTYDIPLDIATKLLTGEYRRIGSVIRYATGPHKGQIVKHLKPVNLENSQEAVGLGEKAVKLAKKNKKALIVVGAAAGIAAVGAGIYKKVKSHEPKVVTEFRAALKKYIHAIRSGTMDVGTIDELMHALDELKKHRDYEKISIQLTSEELEVLVNRIYEYTVKLARDNAVELTSEESERNSGAIIGLQTCLKAQKRIFEAAA